MLKRIDSWLTAFILKVVSPRIHPNDISRSRIILIPCAVGLYYTLGLIWGAGFLILLALTDFIDGRVARGRNLESVEGKQLDALGDYVLAWTIVALLWLEGVLSFETNSTLALCLAVIFAREVSIMFMSALFKEKADKVPSLFLGKVKAALLVAALMLLLVSPVWPSLKAVGEWLLYASTASAAVSWWQYLRYFRQA